MKLQNLQDCLHGKLNALYDVETVLVKELPKLVKGAHDPKLKEAFENHLAETKGHVERLEEVFKSLEMKPGKIKGAAIRGMAEDAAAILEQDGSDDAKDSTLIAAAQYVEHYEIAGYSAAASWAGILGFSEAEDLLEETLAEEENADSLLSDIAEDINERISGGTLEETDVTVDIVADNDPETR